MAAPPPGKRTAESVAAQPPAPAQPPINVKHIAAAWLGLWIVVQAAVWLVAGRSYTLDALTAEEADEDAKILWPVVERHPTLARLLSWIGGPIALARRVHAKIRRKQPKDGDAKASPSDQGSAPGRARSA